MQRTFVSPTIIIMVAAVCWLSRKSNCMPCGCSSGSMKQEGLTAVHSVIIWSISLANKLIASHSFVHSFTVAFPLLWSSTTPARRFLLLPRPGHRCNRPFNSCSLCNTVLLPLIVHCVWVDCTLFVLPSE